MAKDPWLASVRNKPAFIKLLGQAEMQHRDAVASFRRLRGEKLLGVAYSEEISGNRNERGCRHLQTAKARAACNEFFTRWKTPAPTAPSCSRPRPSTRNCGEGLDCPGCPLPDGVVEPTRRPADKPGGLPLAPRGGPGCIDRYAATPFGARLV